MRFGDWLNVPNSFVNIDGKPYLDNSNAEIDNEARVAVRYEGGTGTTERFCASHLTCGGFRSSGPAV